MLTEYGLMNEYILFSWWNVLNTTIEEMEDNYAKLQCSCTCSMTRRRELRHWMIMNYENILTYTHYTNGNKRSKFLNKFWNSQNLSDHALLTLSTLSNFIWLFHSLFWIELKRSVGVKGLIAKYVNINKLWICLSYCHSICLPAAGNRLYYSCNTFRL